MARSLLNLNLQKYNKVDKSNQEKILGVLKDFNFPLSFQTIVILTGLRPDKTSVCLQSLSRWQLVKKVYCRKSSFWVLIKGDKK